MDEYKHLDREQGACVTIELSMEEVARIVISKNYGVHRFLSALVREMREDNMRQNIKWSEKYPIEEYGTLMKDDLCAGIQALLDKGLH